MKNQKTLKLLSMDFFLKYVLTMKLYTMIGKMLSIVKVKKNLRMLLN